MDLLIFLHIGSLLPSEQPISRTDELLLKVGNNAHDSDEYRLNRFILLSSLALAINFLFSQALFFHSKPFQFV